MATTATTTATVHAGLSQQRTTGGGNRNKSIRTRATRRVAPQMNRIQFLMIDCAAGNSDRKVNET
eukprot:5271861-Pyramimonas_sp.AAC.1